MVSLTIGQRMKLTDVGTAVNFLFFISGLLCLFLSLAKRPSLLPTDSVTCECSPDGRISEAKELVTSPAADSSKLFDDNVTRTAAPRSDEDDVSVDQLYEAWSLMYGLKNATPPPSIESQGGWISGQDYPLAPHMQDCELLTRNRVDSETRGPNGESPEWLSRSGVLKDADPPWIRGADNENLAMTRYTQAYLWRHQNPPDCTDPNLKFVIADWVDQDNHGIGSSLHVMVQFFGAVLESNRIFIPKNFHRAEHNQCLGEDYGSLNCYFFPIVSRQCEKHALSLLAEQKDEDQLSNLSKNERLSSATRVISIHYKDYDGWTAKCDHWKPPELGEPWLNDTENLELLGSVFLKEKTEGESASFSSNIPTTWWRAQAIRYMLRWPSKKLCHATNQVRHEVYGRQVALKIVESINLQQEAVNFSRKLDPSEANLLEQIRISEGSLERYSWKNMEPYIPRPIVSIHVRQGDKGYEMRLFSFPAFMYLAVRLRRHVPNIKSVWLSTEMQSVIDATTSYPSWNFLYTKNKRTEGSMTEYEAKIGMDRLITLSFSNLLVAGDCDYFIGVLGSNWNRLINELRLTGGKMSAGILALNYDEW